MTANGFYIPPINMVMTGGWCVQMALGIAHISSLSKIKYPALFKPDLVLLVGWCFGTMEFYDFPFSWEFHHISSSQVTFTPSFFRGVGQPPTSWLIKDRFNFGPILGVSIAGNFRIRWADHGPGFEILPGSIGSMVT